MRTRPSCSFTESFWQYALDRVAFGGRGAEGDGSFHSPLFALRSPRRRHRRKRAVFDENQTALVKLHYASGRQRGLGVGVSDVRAAVAVAEFVTPGA